MSQPTDKSCLGEDPSAGRSDARMYALLAKAQAGSWGQTSATPATLPTSTQVPTALAFTSTPQPTARYLVRAVEDASDTEARSQMLLAATFAGIGFGNAGVHLPHGMSYPVAGRVKSFVPEGYDKSHAIIPHGMSVILNAPSVFRWTASANPERHLQAASWLGAQYRDAGPEDAGEVLATTLIGLMQRTGMPNGLRGVGYVEDDLDELVAGTVPQHRVTKLASRPAASDDLKRLFLGALTYWE